MSVIRSIEKNITDIISSIGYELDNVSLKSSSRPDLGDYQINESMMLGKKNGKKPREVAEEISLALQNSDMFTNINIAGPGFINISLTDEFYTKCVNEIKNIKENNIDYPKKQRIMIDYGGANVAKELHVGHLRPANIGEGLKRLARLLGNEVSGDVHLGDWGLPIGLAIRELKESHPELIYFDDEYTGPYPESSPVTKEDLAHLYPTASIKKNEDPEYLKEAQDIVNKFQMGIPGYKALWKHVVETSKEDIKEVYVELNTSFEFWYGESDAAMSTETVVDIFREKGLARLDDGALIVDVKEEDDNKEIPPILLLKSNGTVGYQTTEIATIYNRMRDFDLDQIWYVTDARQSLHFLQSFRAAKKAHIVPDKVILEHLPFGTINGKDGKPFKTRDGGVMSLRNLIDQVYHVTKSKVNIDVVDKDKVEQTAKIVAVDSIKYADLLPYRTTDYIFDIEKFSDLEGKTAPYLLYSTIRIRSLINKASQECIYFNNYIKISTKTEKQIVLSLLELPRVLSKAFNARSLNDISEYLYDLTSIYNKFYSENKILIEQDEQKRESWLVVSEIVLNVNLMLLDTLGLKVPEKM